MATLLTYSRGTYLAVIASFIVMLRNNKKRLFAFFLLIIICIGGLYANSAIFRSRIDYHTLLNKNERLYIWDTALKMIKDRPVAGFGLGNVFKKNWMAYDARLPACDQFKAYSFIHPHNFLLDITTRLGLIGISLFLYIVFMLVKMCLQIIKNGKDEFIRGWGLCVMSAFIGIFVLGFFDKIFSDMPLCVISTLFAMITILWNLNKSSEESLPGITPGR
jgi:O-antigen ligase